MPLTPTTDREVVELLEAISFKLDAAPPSCARDDCCRRQPKGGVDDLEEAEEATVARVVMEMLERHIGPPRPGRTLGVKWDATANRAAALQEAVLDATMDCRPPGAVSVASPSYTFRVISHPDAVRDRDGVERCRIVRVGAAVGT